MAIIRLDSETQFEQSTVSPHVNQFLVDYMFVYDKLTNKGIAVQIDTCMGDGDLALSILNDAYSHQEMKGKKAIPEEAAVDNP